MDIRELARLGANARITELETEIAAIRKEFPDVVSSNGATAPAVHRTRQRQTKRRKRSHMTAAMRAQVSKRMKAYWAQRRKASKGAHAAK